MSNNKTIDTTWTQAREDLINHFNAKNVNSRYIRGLYKNFPLDETYLYITIENYDNSEVPQRKNNLIDDLKRLKALEKEEINAGLEPTMKQLYLENNWTAFVDDLGADPKFALDCLKETFNTKTKITDDEGNDKGFWFLKTLSDLFITEQSSKTKREQNTYIELLLQNKEFGIKEDTTELENFINVCETKLTNKKLVTSKPSTMKRK